MKSKKTILTVAASALLTITGCKTENRNTGAAVIEPVHDTVAEPRDTVAVAPADTIIYNPSVPAVSAKQDSVVKPVQQNLMATKRVKTQADVLHNKIVESAKPIIAEGLQEIAVTLAPYGLKINWDARADELTNIFSPYGEDLYCLDNDRQRQFEFAWNQNEFLRVLLQKNSVFSQYDPKTQAEIQRIVILGYVGTMRALKRNRVAISKEFAAYYPVLNLDGVPQDLQKLFAGFDPAVMHNGNKIAYGYDNLTQAPVCIERKITVRSGNINPEFFNVDSANYELVSVSRDRWQVARTLNGTVEKSPVFYYNADVDTTWAFGARDDSFNATIFDTKPGVKISVAQVLYKQAAAIKNDKVR